MELRRKSELRRMTQVNPEYEKQFIQSHNEHEKFLSAFKKKAESLMLDIVYINEDSIHSITPGVDDIVFSCGGDGTFLSCAQSYSDSILLGMNSSFIAGDKNFGSKGALTKVNINNISDYLELVHQGKFQIERWNRLSLLINDKPVGRYAVNDIYIGNEVSYLTSKLSIVLDGFSEEFICSGLVASTGMGSHAWFAAAGGSPFSNELAGFGFIVLLPSQKWLPRFVSGVVDERDSISVMPLRNNYVVSFDSKPDVIKLKTGDLLQISIAPDFPLRVIL